MNPRHYQRGWHCTSTLGAIGLAAAVTRLLQLEATQVGNAIALMARVTMTVDSALGVDGPPLTQARVHVYLRDGRALTASVRGARGYSDNPATGAELDANSCRVPPPHSQPV